MRLRTRLLRSQSQKKLDIPLFNTSNKVWRAANKIKIPTSPFHIRDSLRYTKERHNEMVDINTNYPDSIKYIIKFLIGNIMIVTKEFLKSRNVPDIGYIPIFLKGLYKRIK